METKETERMSRFFTPYSRCRMPVWAVPKPPGAYLQGLLTPQWRGEATRRGEVTVSDKDWRKRRRKMRWEEPSFVERSIKASAGRHQAGSHTHGSQRHKRILQLQKQSSISMDVTVPPSRNDHPGSPPTSLWQHQEHANRSVLISLKRHINKCETPKKASSITRRWWRTWQMKEEERGMRMAQWAVSPGNLQLWLNTRTHTRTHTHRRDKGMNIHSEREGHAIFMPFSIRAADFHYRSINMVSIINWVGKTKKCLAKKKGKVWDFKGKGRRYVLWVSATTMCWG